jgi:hypothetical protein
MEIGFYTGGDRWRFRNRPLRSIRFFLEGGGEATNCGKHGIALREPFCGGE